MISPRLATDIEDLIHRSPKQWLQAVCDALESVPELMDATALIATLPVTTNSDAAHCLAGIIRQAEAVLPWNALAASIDIGSSMFLHWRQQQSIELLWSGPSPGSQIPARRIDQVLYDLIASSKRDILLVTFAAYKIHHLADGLVEALNRDVHVRLILEFEETSQGQLSLDALDAFPEIVRQRSHIYYWPLDRRERNSSGRPAKLHAKVAVIDDHAVISSANLTDDAFSRNCELGVVLSNQQILQRIRGHFESLCSDNILRRWENPICTGIRTLSP